MTERERYLATVNHCNPDQLLFYFSVSPALKEKIQKLEGLDDKTDICRYYGGFSPVGIGLESPQDYRQPDWSVYFKDIEIPEGSYFDNNGCLHIPGSSYHFTRYVSPLRNAQSFDDIKSYPWREWSKYQTGHFTEMVKLAHREGRVARVSCTHMYEESWQVRGYEEFLEDMLVHPEWAHFILDRFKERNKLIAIAAAKQEQMSSIQGMMLPINALSCFPFSTGVNLSR